ncbi:hypothetical protein L596_011207 [Steinernema carpocapsae]|uniref:Uncharacterized protein n=1 Tax=Steinernema carpocapsae TaxID=34508 RepID=A0A4U5NU41_STECR|nr:hypothetical protein L596_011207 [Steinernema carpocapsae]
MDEPPWGSGSVTTHAGCNSSNLLIFVREQVLTQLLSRVDCALCRVFVLFGSAERKENIMREARIKVDWIELDWKDECDGLRARGLSVWQVLVWDGGTKHDNRGQ